jgi:hypothetical protein
MRMSAVSALVLVVAGMDAADAAAQQCPNVDPMAGYAVAVAPLEGASPGLAYLQEFARAVAYRWATPSRARGSYSGWDRASRRLLPPEPRWADDWSPGEQHRARVMVTIYRTGTPRAQDPAPRSGDRTFDNSLRSAFANPLPGSPPLPALPPEWAGDSLVLAVWYGLPDSAGAQAAVVRFAAQQSPVRMIGTMSIRVPFTTTSLDPGGTPPRAPSHRLTVKYDVREDGSVDMGSFEILETSDRQFARLVQDEVMRMRFHPAHSNCRPVAMSVVQTMGR